VLSGLAVNFLRVKAAIMAGATPITSCHSAAMLASSELPAAQLSAL